MTLNKDTKTPGETTGFSTNIGAVQRWEINASYRAELRKVFHLQHINFNPQSYKHKDLTVDAKSSFFESFEKNKTANIQYL